MLLILGEFTAGLFVLLWGMQAMKEGLENLSREKIRRAVAAFTATPLKAAVTGLVFTMLVQSSTAISVITIGFVNAGIMNLAQAVGILLGANVGTCVTVQLLSFNLFRLAAPAALGGAVLWAIFKSRPAGHLGRSLCGFGLVFAGLQLMATALAPLQKAPWFLETLLSLQHSPAMAVLAGALVSALLHSSAAATGIAMLLSGYQLIALPTAVALVLGNNIGTCITAVLASLGGSRAGRQVAAAHVLLNVLGALLFLPLLHPFATLVSFTTDTLPRQVANAHALFNIISSLIALPLVYQFTALVRMIVPGNK
ncbi:Na/Pi cotransporter family protein [Desulfallas thermosapovorans]|uniref:Phosphate:Na+ symporter n=1 Tax=Desulfallas thermosapovorans DSM 6562 TaxID=1121431 RepID=A0A5S4ZTC9_9FIRM|nr:Na/Pi symporter [Desulfallas thermosapovorans]TYO95940.1 phosphate:Na+ symporter [Desulfallas thermosapovorans DSM 6562]